MHIAANEVASSENQRGRSQITKRSVILNGHKTSVSLEGPFGSNSSRLLPNEGSRLGISSR